MARKVKELDPYIKARVGEALLKLEGLIKPSNLSGTSRLYYTGQWAKDVYDNYTNKQAAVIFKKVEKLTSSNNTIQINMALNYGSRQEIINSLNKLLKKKLIINEKNIQNNLYTAGIPDPEILIRTGDTKRISNFLIWQSIYTELFFEKKMWPDFSRNDFYRILNKFGKLKRNFGGLNDRN